MKCRASVALALCALSLNAVAGVPVGSDNFDSLATSQDNWFPPIGTSLSIGNGHLEFSSSSATGGWQWKRFESGNRSWAFQTDISMPSGLVSGSDFVILGLQAQGSVSAGQGTVPASLSDYIQLTANNRQFIASSTNGTSPGVDAPNTLSALRLNFDLTDPNTGAGTLLAQYAASVPPGKQPYSWTTIGSLPNFIFDPSGEILFIFSQSQIDQSRPPITAASGIWADNVRAVPEPSSYAFFIIGAVVIAWVVRQSQSPTNESV
jgi:hypothetical protein